MRPVQPGNKLDQTVIRNRVKSRSGGAPNSRLDFQPFSEVSAIQARDDYLPPNLRPLHQMAS